MRGSAYGVFDMDSMPPATATFDVPGLNALRGQHHGAQPGSADHVQCQRAHGVGEAGAERRLPGRRLAFAGRDDIAHQAFVDVRWIDARSRERFTNGDGAKLRRGEAFQRAKELAGRVYVRRRE